jgi:hypothetical protein
MAGILRVPRSRGALSGVLLILLGAWGALIPLVGPYFHYAYTPDTAWSFTSGRIWLEIAPGAAAFIGGLIVVVSSLRPVAMFGAWLAALAGAWFVAGTTLSALWTTGGVSAIGSPVGGTVTRTAEQIGFFTGLGVVIAFLAALVIGRLSVVAVRDARLAESRDARHAADRRADEAEALPVRDTAVRDTAVRDTAVRDTAATGHTTADESAAGDEAADPVVYDATAGRSAAAEPVEASPAAEKTSATRA